MTATAAHAPRIRALARLVIAAGLALGIAVPIALGASAREFEPGDDHGHGVETGDDHGGLAAPGPGWSAPAWPTTDDHGGWFHD